jgi:hypothetical protein
MMAMPGEISVRLLGYYLSGALSDTGLGEDFSQLADIGPVSHIISRDFSLHLYMLDTCGGCGQGRGQEKQR